jgi:V8-like Glu-specific endopeptidase/cell wall-associated NlpC family hydrolase
MPRIQANRDTIDDRFSVLGFTVRTESPLFEVAVATDPSLFKPENRARRARSNFFSSRAQGVTRARRGEAVYLVPPDVLGNFVGQPRLYFGLATYRENSRGAPDFVQAPTDGSMYVGMGQLTERGLRRSVGTQTGLTYGAPGGRDTSLDWGGDSTREAMAATPAAARSATSTAPTPAVAVAAGYDDGFGAFPDEPPPGAYGSSGSSGGSNVATEPIVRSQEVLLRAYNGDLASQLRLFAETAQWIAGVADTTHLPHSAICHVLVYAGDTLKGRATAFYIGRNLLMTNAHVLKGHTRMVVIPGKNGVGTDRAHEPFGRFSVDLTNATSRWHPSFNGGRAHDMGVVKVPQAAPNGLWLTPIEELRQSRPEGVAVCGYSAHSRRGDLVATIVHATLDPEKQHVHRGYVRTVDDDSFSYDVQELAGSSGSPVYWIEGGAAPRVHVVGVNAGPKDDTTNEGCRLTDAKLAWIRGIATEWGIANAMEVNESMSADAAAYPLTIPLDPGAGGRSIGVAALKAGDIVVSTTRAFASRIIRLGTVSPVSHVMLYVGDGKVIESAGSGVRETTLDAAIADAILAVAYRHPQLDATRATAVVAHARSRIGNPYNIAGVAFIGYRMLNPLPAAVIEAIGRRLGVEPGQAGAVYCSELVLECFERAGVPLTVGARPAQSTPDQIAQFARSSLGYVGHLKAEDVPMGIQLGLADAFDTPVGQAFSVHWSGVPLYAQTSPMSCWAAAAAMIVAWRDQVSITDQTIAQYVPVIDAYKRGLFPAERRPLADAWGLVPEPPASYTIQRWCQMLTDSGPLYIDMNWSPNVGGHARVLVGMTSSGAADGSDTTMYLHDPWPGTVGHIKLPFNEFLKLYEGRVGNSGPDLRYQILHAGTVPAGRHTLRTAPFALMLADQVEPPQAEASKLVEAQADGSDFRRGDARADEPTLPAAPPALIQQPLELEAPVAEAQALPLIVPIAAAVIGAVFTRVLSNTGDVSWQLDQMSGLKHPNDQLPSPLPPFQDGPLIRLVDWPSTGGIGTISAGFEIRWQHNGESLGNVQIDNVASQDAALWGLEVKARIMNDSIVYPRNAPRFAALKVRIEYRFTHTVFSDRLAYREIHLFGNGTYNLTGDWTQNTFF